MIACMASREGLTGRRTAAGFLIGQDEDRFNLDDLFVALPSRRALGRWIRIIYDGKTATVPVGDVGPWFPYRNGQPDGYPDDDQYVFGKGRPLAAQLKGQVRASDEKQYTINGAGIDLSDGLITVFGVAPEKWGVRPVAWEFLDPEVEGARA